MEKETYRFFEKKLKGYSAEAILGWAAETYPEKAVFSTSLGLEDQVITSIISNQKLNINIFTIDTGRQFEESYKLLEETIAQYHIPITVFKPDHRELEPVLEKLGPNFFKTSVERRKLCCNIRKIQPLQRALFGREVWVTGIRRGQSFARAEVQPIEWVETNKILKINPLWNWSEQQIWDYIHANNTPFNKLHLEGYPSIGCAPCTRAVGEGEDPRSGRWWWEQGSKRECGLHNPKNPNFSQRVSV